MDFFCKANRVLVACIDWISERNVALGADAFDFEFA